MTCIDTTSDTAVMDGDATPAAPDRVPCLGGCGRQVTTGTKTGKCPECVREAWRTGELTHGRQPYRETPKYVRNLGSMIRALPRRIGDRKDIENLSAFGDLRAEINRAERDTVTRLRAAGYSWADIGRVLGITRQAAFDRFGGPR